MARRQKTLRDLGIATRVAVDAQAVADEKLNRRDDIAADLADRGVKYADLAEAMGITVDGVTYVLRKVRARRAKATPTE